MPCLAPTLRIVPLRADRSCEEVTRCMASSDFDFLKLLSMPAPVAPSNGNKLKCFLIYFRTMLARKKAGDAMDRYPRFALVPKPSKHNKPQSSTEKATTDRHFPHTSFRILSLASRSLSQIRDLRAEKSVAVRLERALSNHRRRQLQNVRGRNDRGRGSERERMAV